MLASVPDKPTSAPASDTAVTSVSMIRVTYTDPASDKGTSLTNYEVQIDDDIGGILARVAGGDGFVYLMTHFISQGGGTFSNSEACELAVTGYRLDSAQHS